VRQWGIGRSAILGASLLALASCEGTTTKQVGEVDSVDGPLGGAASDEPRATLVAQDILSAGGTAVDAATALYFTLAVTYPIAGSLGGGGECIVYNNEKNELENLKFPIGAPANGGAIGIPGNIRGFAALHARYGRMDWSALLSPAEKFANFGESLSRAQHMAMVTSSSRVRFNEALENIYKKKDGSFRVEGEKIEQIQLASILTTLRSAGGVFFYTGNVGKSFVEDANALGGSLTSADLFNYKPRWEPAVTFNADVNTVGVSNSAYGELYRDLWLSVFDGKGFLQLDQDIPLSKVIEISRASFQKANLNAKSNLKATTSFVTADNEGNAVSCVVGMKKPFGTGKAGYITGIVMPPNIPDAQGEQLTTPVLMVNKPNKDFYYASAASGGPAGVFSSVYTALQVIGGGKSLESSMISPRALTMGTGQPLLYEKKVPTEVLNAVGGQHPVQIEVDRLGQVNAIYCFEGKVFNCESHADPRGFGLSMIQR